MAEEEKTQLDTLTDKYSEKFEKFSNSKSGNIILDFMMFKRNLLPYTLLIVYSILVLVVWALSVLCIFREGPLTALCDSKLSSFGLGVLVFVAAPFVIHYFLEFFRIVWLLVAHVFNKVIVPVWNQVVLNLFAVVIPESLPGLYGVLISKVEPVIDALIDVMNTLFMSVVAVLKGTVWLPKKVCQRLGRWLDKTQDSSVQDK